MGPDRRALELFNFFKVKLSWSILRLKCLLNGGQSQPASISRQGFADKSLQSSPTFSKLNCSSAVQPGKNWTAAGAGVDQRR
jgi:hypothetical protein